MKKVYRVTYTTHPTHADLQNGTNAEQKFRQVVARSETEACDKICDADVFAVVQSVKLD